MPDDRLGHEHRHRRLGGPRGVQRTRVCDATGQSDGAHFVATFATASVGLLVEILAVRAEVAPIPHDRRPWARGTATLSTTASRRWRRTLERSANARWRSTYAALPAAVSILTGSTS